MGDSSEKQPKKNAGSEQKTSFWQGVKAEYRKITWPDKESTLKQSVVVTVISIVLGLIIAVIDYAAKYGVNFLTTLSF